MVHYMSTTRKRASKSTAKREMVFSVELSDDLRAKLRRLVGYCAMNNVEVKPSHVIRALLEEVREQSPEFLVLLKKQVEKDRAATREKRRKS